MVSGAGDEVNYPESHQLTAINKPRGTKVTSKAVTNERHSFWRASSGTSQNIELQEVLRGAVHVMINHSPYGPVNSTGCRCNRMSRTCCTWPFSSSS